MRIATILLVVCLACFATVARADVTPPGLEDCRLLKGGDACERRDFSGKSEGKGICLDTTCGKIDYANWNRDASATPPSARYDCRICTLEKDLPSDGGVRDDDDDEKDRGCALGVPGKTRQRLLALLLAAGVALLIRRRRAR